MARRAPSKSETPVSEIADDAFNALLAAIVENDGAACEKLLRQEPDLASCQVKHALFEPKFSHCLYVNDTALHWAAAGHRDAIAKMLITAGADPNAHLNHRAGCPLHYAADGEVHNPHYDATRQVKTLQILIKAGADLQAADKNGATALHRAVRTRCAAAVECLLRAGADPNARNHSGSTPYDLALCNTGRGGSGTPAAKTAQKRIIELLKAQLT